MADVPFQDMLRGFLNAARGQHYETTVVAIPRGTGATIVASNNGEAGVAKARTRLLIKDGAIEQTAMALHAFRFVETGKQVVPEMDMCPLLACADTEVGGTPAAFLLWEKLPPELQEAHRMIVKILIGAAVSGSVEEEKKIISDA